MSYTRDDKRPLTYRPFANVLWHFHEKAQRARRLKQNGKHKDPQSRKAQPKGKTRRTVVQNVS